MCIEHPPKKVIVKVILFVQSLKVSTQSISSSFAVGKCVDGLVGGWWEIVKVRAQI